MDPPYKDKNLNSIFENIKNTKILKKGIIILHRHKMKKIFFQKALKLLRRKSMDYLK